MRLISFENFTRDWQPFYNRVFSGRRVAEGCFQNAAWTCVLVPYRLGSIEETTYQALMDAASSVGDKQCIVTDIEQKPLHQETVLIDWDWEELYKLASETLLTVCDAALFGESARWGALSMQSEDGYSCIGGDAAFMAAFILAAGNEQSLKERFAEFARSEWFVSEEEKAAIFKTAGWELPDSATDAV